MKFEKRNNKGFSLVELIIVIAIMAALVGVLTPQYIRYIEKSKVASDEQLLEEISTALMVLSTQSDFSLWYASENSYKDISIRFDPTTGIANFKDKELKDNSVFFEIVDTNKTYKLQSKTYKGVIKEIKLAFNPTYQIYQVRLVYVDNQEVVVE